jgi:hypothetical protein
VIVVLSNRPKACVSAEDLPLSLQRTSPGFLAIAYAQTEDLLELAADKASTGEPQPSHGKDG